MVSSSHLVLASGYWLNLLMRWAVSSNAVAFIFPGFSVVVLSVFIRINEGRGVSMLDSSACIELGLKVRAPACLQVSFVDSIIALAFSAKVAISGSEFLASNSILAFSKIED